MKDNKKKPNQEKTNQNPSNRRQKSRSNQKRKILLNLAFLILFGVIQQSGSVQSPSTYLFSTRQFKGLTNHPSSNTMITGMAIASTGEAYSIKSSNYNNPTKFTFQDSSGSAYLLPLRNGLFLNHELFLGLFENSAQSKIDYFLMQPTTPGGTTLRALAGGVEVSGSLAGLSFSDQMDSMIVPHTSSFLVSICHSTVNFLTIKPKQKTLTVSTPDSYPTNPSDFTARSYSKHLIVWPTPTKYRLVSKVSGGTEYYLPSFYQQTSTETFSKVVWTTGQVQGPFTSTSNYLITHHGMRYNYDTVEYREHEKTLISLVDGKKACLEKFGDLGRSRFHCSADHPASYHFVGLTSMPGTRYAVYTALSKVYAQGDPWNSNTDFKKLIFYEISTLGFWDSDAQIKLLFERTVTSVPFGSSGLFLGTGEAIFVADWKSVGNIIYAPELMNLGCLISETAHMVEQSVKCADPATLRPNCKKVDPVRLSCLECKDNAGGVVYTRIKTPKLNDLDYYSCKASNLICDNSAGFYIKPDGTGCYTCSEALPGCSQCSDFSITCLKCSPGFGLTKTDSEAFSAAECYINGCSACSTDSLTCAICDEGRTPSTDFKKCVSAQEVQPSCLVGARASRHCKSCKSPWRLKGNGACQFCGGGKFYSEKDNCFTCSFSVGDSTQCNGCLNNQVDTCSNCWSDYAPNPLNHNICEPGCPDGEYWSTGSAGCLSCPSMCRRCVAETGLCLECIDGWIKDSSGDCRRECGEFEYYGGSGTDNCLRCSAVAEIDPNCFSCQDVTGVCSSCKGGLILDPATKFCRKKCSGTQYWTGKTVDSCLECSRAENSNPQCKSCGDITHECEECNSGYKILEGSSLDFCRKECSGSQYWRGEALNACGECLEKTAFCAECQDESGICSRCQSGYRLLENKSCRKECGEGEYWKAEAPNSCQSCSATTQYCSQCLDETGECQKCQQGYSLLKESQNSSCQSTVEDRKIIKLTNKYFSAFFCLFTLACFSGPTSSSISGLSNLYWDSLSPGTTCSLGKWPGGNS